MDINILRPQVGLPTSTGQVQKSYDTPIAGAIGQAVGQVGQFAQAYDQAKLESDFSTAHNLLKTNVNDYLRNREENLPALDGRDIEEVWREDWAADGQQLFDGVMETISDSRAKDALTKYWEDSKVEIENQLLNQAQNIDISLRGTKQQEIIQSAIDRGDLTDAQMYIAAGEGKFWSSTQAYEMNQIAAYQVEYNGEQDKVLNAYNSDIPFKESYDQEKTRIAEEVDDPKMQSDLNKLNSDMYKQKTIAAKEQLKVTQEQQIDHGQTSIWSGLIQTDTQLLQAFDTDYSDLDSGQKKSLMGILNTQQREREAAVKGEKIKGDSEALIDVENSLMLGDRTKTLELISEYMSEGKLTTGDRENAIKKMNSGVYANMNDIGAAAFKKSLDQLVSDDVITRDERFSVQQRWGDFIQTFTPEDIATEKYYNSVDDFFGNIRSENVSWSVNKLQETLREEDNFSYKNQESEKFLKEIETGRFTGQVDIASINTYLRLPEGNKEALRESSADYLYPGRSYDDLSRKEKNKANLSVALGEYSKSVLRLADQELGVGGRVVVDGEGYPSIRIGEGDQAISYRLQMNEAGVEEEWYAFDANRGWVAAGITIPERRKTPTFIGTVGREILQQADIDEVNIQKAEEVLKETNPEIYKAYTDRLRPFVPGRN